jgi:hypothetical protein
MSTITSVFIKVFAREFYRQNTGFFLIILCICVGFIRDVEHVAMAGLFLSSKLLITIPITIWLLYTLKVVLFNNQAAHKRENEFCYQFANFPHVNQWITSSWVIICQLAPVILYSLFLSTMAILHQLYSMFFIINAAVVGLITFSASVFQHYIWNPDKDVKVSRIKQWLDKNVLKPYSLICFEWLLRNESFVMLGTKAFATAIIWAIAYLYTTDVYDERLMGMGIVVAFSSNVVLLFHLHRLENKIFSITRNLPLTFFARLKNVMLTMIMLCAVEAIVISRKFMTHLSAQSILYAICFGFSILVFYYGWFFIKSRPLEKIIRQCLFITLLLIMVVLSGIPFWVLTGINMIIGMLMWQKHYYSFESLPE